MQSEILNSLEAKERERLYLIQVLRLWDVAKEAGYDASEVKAFSFRPKFLNKEEKREYRRKYPMDNSLLKVAVDYHNCVRLHTGELKPIPLTKRPKK